MQHNRSSFTAQVAAFLRAAHQALPEDERISHDPYASHMLDSSLWRRLANWRTLGRGLDRWKPGVIDLIALRDRFADEQARHALSAHGGSASSTADPQLVMLGAGLDTMLWRLDIPGLITFEVDFPATQQHRQRVIARGGPFPERHVVRVAMDFESESLVERLQEAGFQSDRPTVINWMGVSYYLERDAVAAVLRDVRELTNEQSVLVFDFFQPPSPLSPSSSTQPRSSPSRSAQPRDEAAVYKKIGEPLKFFMAAADFPGFAAEQGFDVLELTSLDELGGRYANRPRISTTPVMLTAVRPKAEGRRLKAEG